MENLHAVIATTANEPAWERRSEIGYFSAIFKTIYGILFLPGKTFSRLQITGGFLTPLSYYFLVIFGVSILKHLRELPLILKGSSHQAALFIMLVFLTPIVSMLSSSVVAHLSLKLVRSAKESFEATFRVCCYTAGSAFIFLMFFDVPFVVSIWQLIIYFIGLKKVHCLSGRRMTFFILVYFPLMFFVGFMLLRYSSISHYFIPMPK